MQVILSTLLTLAMSGPAGKEAPLHCSPAVITEISWPEMLPPDAMPADNGYTVALAGDIMMGTTFPEERLPASDGNELFRDCLDVLLSADIAAGNLEGVLSDDGESTKRIVEGRSYVFRMPERYAGRLSGAGFDFMSLANNHVRDFGEEGIMATMEALENEEIAYAGLPSCRFAVAEKNGTRFGFCAFGHNFYTLRHTDGDCVRDVVTALRKECDILIVSFHGGAEGADMSHLPYGTETYLGENRGNLRKFAHTCIDLGADIVFGHGPHVTRAMEVYKGRFIAYSLGNFCTPFGMNISGVNGYAPVVEIRIGRDGRFKSGKIHSFIQVPGAGPRTDVSGKVARHIADLTRSDITDSVIDILPDGVIVLRHEAAGNE